MLKFRFVGIPLSERLPVLTANARDLLWDSYGKLSTVKHNSLISTRSIDLNVSKDTFLLSKMETRSFLTRISFASFCEGFVPSVLCPFY